MTQYLSIDMSMDMPVYTQTSRDRSSIRSGLSKKSFLKRPPFPSLSPLLSNKQTPGTLFHPSPLPLLVSWPDQVLISSSPQVFRTLLD